MLTASVWTRQQLLVPFALYCRLPFGRLHSWNPEIAPAENAIGPCPSALAMQLSNMTSLDPAITSTGHAGLRNVSANDRAMWEEMQSDWERFALDSSGPFAKGWVRQSLMANSQRMRMWIVLDWRGPSHANHSAHRSKFLPRSSDARL